jgi:hypothetical protein
MKKETKIPCGYHFTEVKSIRRIFIYLIGIYSVATD